MKRLFLTLSLVGNLGLLAVFKYADFFIENVNALFTTFGITKALPLLNIALPIGISFYTFQTLSYTLDIYWGSLKPTKLFRRFALFVAFFPQLVAGPIVRAADLLPQLKKRIILEGSNMQHGLTLIAWGLVKKVLFADNIAHLVEIFFADPTVYTSTLLIYIGVIGFAVQIYCDFSGYSDIAIGLARIMGIYIKPNFLKPYFTKNIAEFWRKWHISLSSWIRDYLYNPFFQFLSKRKMFATMKNTRLKTKIFIYASTIFSFTIIGLWHGASWNFVLFGLYQGIIVSVYYLFKDLQTKSVFVRKFGTSAFLSKTAILINLFFILFGFILFRLKDMSAIRYTMSKFLLVNASLSMKEVVSFISQFKEPIFFIVLFIILHTVSYYNGGFFKKIASAKIFYWFLFMLVVILGLFFFSPTESMRFVYFQF